MAVNPLTDLLKLPADDRAELAIALWESLDEAERDGVFDLTAEQRRELDRRWEEHQRNPASAVPWCEVRRKLLG
jgi:putative addiction module component (TIGR02574 family)